MVSALIVVSIGYARRSRDIAGRRNDEENLAGETEGQTIFFQYITDLHSYKLIQTVQFAWFAIHCYTSTLGLLRCRIPHI
jgi:hypothetical protein